MEHDKKENQLPVKEKGINHFIYATIIFLIALWIYFQTGGITNITVDKVSFLLVRKTLTLVICMFLSYYWRTKKYDVDWRIAKEPNAIAIYHGLMFLAIGYS